MRVHAQLGEEGYASGMARDVPLVTAFRYSKKRRVCRERQKTAFPRAKNEPSFPSSRDVIGEQHVPSSPPALPPVAAPKANAFV